MTPTLRQLHYLKLLAEHGSFSRAAEAAHVTQPTLSAGIQELEKILGATVVERGRSGILLTPAGQAVAERAGPLLTAADDLVQAAQGAGRPLSGKFRLGVIPTIAPFLLPRGLPVLRERYPDLKLYLREDLTPRLVAALRAGTLDAALIALPYEMKGLEWAHVADDEILAAAPMGHAIESQTTVDLDTIDGRELILLEDGHCLRDHALAASGLPAPKDNADGGFAATSLPTLVQMVGSGLGVSFLPRMAVDAGLARAANICVRPLAAEHPSREIVVAWRKGSARAQEGRLLAEALKDRI